MASLGDRLSPNEAVIQTTGRCLNAFVSPTCSHALLNPVKGRWTASKRAFFRAFRSVYHANIEVYKLLLSMLGEEVVYASPASISVLRRRREAFPRPARVLEVDHVEVVTSTFPPQNTRERVEMLHTGNTQFGYQEKVK